MNEYSQFSFPEGFIEQLTPLLGASLPDFLRQYELPPLRGVRTRPGCPPPPEATQPVPWAENGWYLPLYSTAGNHPLHEAGAWYLQEPSAMTAAAVLHPLPGERVLDLCAAPGGKSTQLAAFMQGQGTLICNEPNLSRAQILSRNIERMGVTNAAVTVAYPENLSPKFGHFFDKILVDAPCSGEGMFRRHPETREQWNPASPAGCAQRQQFILQHAAQMLAPGGVLVYSTCTMNRTENDDVVQDFLANHPDFTLEPFSLPGLPENDGTLHVWPHQVQGEGHFVARLRKTGEGKPAQAVSGQFSMPAKDAQTAAQSFLKEHMVLPCCPNGMFGEHLVQLPAELPVLQGIKVLRVGLQLGFMKGKIFFPDHALALAVPARKTLPVDIEAARAYLAGNPLPVEETIKGFLTPTLNGMALGWGKASDGSLKNHYPKGLRKTLPDLSENPVNVEMNDYIHFQETN